MAEYLFKIDTIKSCYSETKENCPFCFIAIKNGGHHCSLSSCKCLTTKRPNDCPLVELSPHGRLGDLDKLYEVATAPYGNLYGFQALINDIKNAPTVIEAS